MGNPHKPAKAWHHSLTGGAYRLGWLQAAVEISISATNERMHELQYKLQLPYQFFYRNNLLQEIRLMTKIHRTFYEWRI